MKKSALYISFIVFIFTVLAISGPGCANIIPPTGGPRDSLPPVLVGAAPKDSTLNFRGKRITLTFNEYVDLQEVQQNLLFNPLFETVPEVSVKLKTINVRLRDSLLPNTTYTFNFGNAIRDINEGNPFANFTYTFSTGPFLDSLELSGSVLLAQSGQVDTTITVVLHVDRTDSAVVKQRPRYATKLDSAGRFTFRNLPRDTFAIYALGDAGTLRRYTSPRQYFAFADSPVVSGRKDPLTLYAYREEEEQKKTPTAPAGGKAGDKRLRMNYEQGAQDLLQDFLLTFERPLRTFDSTKMRLTTDTVFTPVPNYSVTLDSSRKQLRLKTAWKEGADYNLIVDKDFAEDTLGRKLLKTDTLNFTTKSQKDYGGIRIRVRNVDTTQQPVLLFVQNEAVVFSTSVKSGQFAQNLFVPGEYELRILFDRNGNGKWDPGQFFGPKKQPELVRPTGQTINVKAGIRNDINLSL
ncbi:Ig-like domain-containing protein [Paraflavisolibacter sp. H34]|uniref:Ig-like domain-containing protein n=1 Tax=Huijunlia imazamoxiresistens TaxID=3127457 RepID=UPI003017A5DE